MSCEIPTVYLILGLHGGLSLHVRVIFAEYVGYGGELGLTAVCKDAHTRLFLYAEGSWIFESLVMSAALVVCASDRFDKHAVSINFIRPALRFAFFLFVARFVTQILLDDSDVDLIFFVFVLAS